MNALAEVKIKAWTPSLVKRFCELWDQQKTFSQISDLIGMSRNACIGKAHRLGLVRVTEEMTEEQRRLREAAVSLATKVRLNTFFERRGTYSRPHSIPPKPKPVNDLSEIALHVSFDDLKHYHCRFPYGSGPFTFCGHPKAKGSYCAAHAAYCYEVRQ